MYLWARNLGHLLRKIPQRQFSTIYDASRKEESLQIYKIEKYLKNCPKRCFLGVKKAFLDFFGQRSFVKGGCQPTARPSQWLYLIPYNWTMNMILWGPSKSTRFFVNKKSPLEGGRGVREVVNCQLDYLCYSSLCFCVDHLVGSWDPIWRVGSWSTIFVKSHF